MKLSRLSLVALIATVAFSSFTAKKFTSFYFAPKSGVTDHSVQGNYDAISPASPIGGANNQLAWISIEDVDNSGTIDATEFTAAYGVLEQTSNTTLNDDTQGTRVFTVSGVNGNAVLEKKP